MSFHQTKNHGAENTDLKLYKQRIESKTYVTTGKISQKGFVVFSCNLCSIEQLQILDHNYSVHNF